MEKFSEEDKEKISNVDLRIIPPQGDKHHMIGFDAKTPKEARSYNDAVFHHLNVSFNSIFHQVGGSDHSKPGFHAWEIWDTNIDEEELEKILTVIERDAQILIEEDDFEVLDEKLYKRWDKDREKKKNR